MVIHRSRSAALSLIYGGLPMVQPDVQLSRNITMHVATWTPADSNNRDWTVCSSKWYCQESTSVQKVICDQEMSGISCRSCWHCRGNKICSLSIAVASSNKEYSSTQSYGDRQMQQSINPAVANSTTLPLQRGLVPFQVRSLVQIRVEARSASMVKPGEHWKLTVWLYVKSLPNLTPLAGTPGSPQLITAWTNRDINRTMKMCAKEPEEHCFHWGENICFAFARRQYNRKSIPHTSLLRVNKLFYALWPNKTNVWFVFACTSYCQRKLLVIQFMCMKNDSLWDFYTLQSPQLVWDFVCDRAHLTLVFCDYIFHWSGSTMAPKWTTFVPD